MDKTLTEMLDEMVKTVKSTNDTLERIIERNNQTYERLNKSIKNIEELSK
jgi:uncharacterized protein Yka (UPF0111/DUF47 family)